MTEKQRAFVKAYTGEYIGDIAGAYMSVYKNSKADSALKSGLKLLEKDEIIKLINKQLGDGKKVATSNEIQAYLTQIMRGEVSENVVDMDEAGEEHLHKKPVEVHPRERLKAAELLGKAQGVFTNGDNEDKNEPPMIIDDI